ncbi:DNA endonuclease RBBP8 [Genypterus blacodes]|uniref:DNA endonuclease RBBP8 n=1 Tax=Genypterus blacodes TaxID=154954 RepID=UPI003F75FD87
MSSPSLSSGYSGTPKAAGDLFEDLYKQLGECHQKALQDLEVKVSKLKRERCLDAQRLEEFYNRNQQLKEQHKNLQDIIGHLKERLRAGECDRCGILEENLKNEQDQNVCLIAKLKSEKNCLEDENRKLKAELQNLKSSHAGRQQSSSPPPPSSEQEEGVIPDSPLMPSLLPVVNRLKKRKTNDKVKHIRYAEKPLPQPHNFLFNELNTEPVDAPEDHGRADVLVPNTCEMDASQNSDVNHNLDEVVAETCRFELPDRLHTKETQPVGQQSSSASSWKYDIRLRPYCLSSSSSTPGHHPDSTPGTSSSLPPRVARLSDDSSLHRAKRRKEVSDPEGAQEKEQGVQEEAQEPDLIKQIFLPPNRRSFTKETSDSKVQSARNKTSSQKLAAFFSPAYTKTNGKIKENTNGDNAGVRRSLQPDLNNSMSRADAEDAELQPKVEPMWSIDPALALSMYESEDWRAEEQEEEHSGESVDPDCTMISHSLLQRRGEKSQNRGANVSGLGEKANDSLDQMFDTTAYGEYKSFNSPHGGHSQACSDEEEEEEEEEKEEEDEQNPPGNTPTQRKKQERNPTFAHVVVVRKKEERRKLKGATCKECEVYYAHLPEEEREKKLSLCSRHRFLYVPPCTPENFWEVGFPSTQTCIERGYIKEETNPQARSRRRQPYNALFSPKGNKENV